MAAIKSKKVSDSQISLAQLMQPEHANSQGNVHGGWIMKLVDEAGALACMRHAQTRVVTVALDQMMFREPIKIGDLVSLHAEVSYVGNTSMEVQVDVIAENPITGSCIHTNTAYLVYVALDDFSKPVLVPKLLVENDEQRERMDEAKKRQEYRLSQIKKNKLTKRC